MKACYKKIKTVVKPSLIGGGGKENTNISRGGSKSKNEVTKLTPAQLRHAKCHEPRSSDTYHPIVLRRRRTLSPPTTTNPGSIPLPGSLTLAQIRSVPLNIKEIRSKKENQRSSYVINAEQIRRKLLSSSLKRSRSLSPQILRNTSKLSELKSPKLVRSVSNCGKRRLNPDEEESNVLMAHYQQIQHKKQRHQNSGGGSSSYKPPSKSRLILQALVGGNNMDSNQLESPPPSLKNHIYQDPKKLTRPSTLNMNIPRHQVQPIQQKPLLLFKRNQTNSLYSDYKGPRGFMGRQGPPQSSSLFDDDPGIMSEVETASTGFMRGSKARNSLPVVRTPSKTLERPLGLVFLQYRSETKRALLPNEITSMDTVKALFVRSFPRQLTLEYLDAMNGKIYIHDSGKDMFYELEDLRDIRGNSVLRLFEPNINGNGSVPSWDQDQSYFSEPEFDSDFQHQHIHKSKGNKSPYLPPYAYPIGATLPRSRPYSPLVPLPAKSVQNSSIPPPKPVRNSTVPPIYSLVKRPIPPGIVSPSLYSPPRVNPTTPNERSTSFPPHYNNDPRNPIYSSADPSGYISSPERTRYLSEDPYNYYPPPSRSGSITPVIIDEEARFRMEHMERQLANLTGLVQKIVQPPSTPTPTPIPIIPNNQRIHANTLPRNIGATNYSLPQQQRITNRDLRDDTDKLSSSSSASLPDERPPNPIDKILTHPKFGKEKSVSFSDDPPELSKQYSPSIQPVEKPTKPAIKSSTLPRMSQVSDRIVPVQPQQMKIPLSGSGYITYGRADLSPEMYNQLRNLQKKAKELKSDVRVLRRNVQAQAHSVRETLRDTFLRFKVVTLAGNDQWLSVGGDPEKVKLKKEEDLYRQEMMKLDKDLTDLELTVEELRSHVINKRTRVNMSDVENMALVLSKSSKSVADLKARFPALQDSMRNQLGTEMDRMVSEERFLKDEPDHLENSLRRCKKLTGTLVTLKRLASVQEQRLPSTDSIRSLPCTSPTTPTDKLNNRKQGWKWSSHFRQIIGSGLSTNSTTTTNTYPTTYFMVTPNSPAPTGQNPENQLDALLDELNAQEPPPPRSRLNPPDPPKRLPSYPSTESGGSPVRIIHPPIPPKPTKIPPLPPPRSSSKNSPALTAIDSDSTESLNSQQDSVLNERHQELLRKQKQLQDQYARLQFLSSSSSSDKHNGRLSLLQNGESTGIIPIPISAANETDIL